MIDCFTAGSGRSKGTAGQQDVEVWYERRSLGRAQVASTAARVDQVTCLRTSRVSRQHAEPRGTRHPGHEHCPVVYEGKEG